MSGHTLVINYNKEAIASFNSATFVVCTDDLSQLHEISCTVQQKNHLFVIKAVVDMPLAAIRLSSEDSAIPLALYLPEMGAFRDVVPLIPLLKGFNLRIFFPAGRADNYPSCRILSSLGIATGLFFNGAEPDWNALTDLMAYTMYGKAPHAPIEPFYHHIVNYKPTERNSWDAVFFNDPERYLHVSLDGKLALRSEHLRDGRFVSEDLCEIYSIRENAAYQAHLEEWRTYFLEEEGCAYCDAWRVCLGSFSKNCGDRENGCKKFFREVMEAADDYQRLQSGKRSLWQP